MKYLFYENFYRTRLNRIINIFGKNWFIDKQILELGAAHGNIGIELLKLGANVTFSDLRPELLNDIKDILNNLNYDPTLVVLDQNKNYDLKTKFDLVLHLSILYNIENWQNDLKCALQHTDTMILETVVNPAKNSDQYFNVSNSNKYGNINCKSVMISQESIENELRTLGCRFIRFDDPDLNCNWGWVDNNNRLRHVYDWNYDTVEVNKVPGYNTHYRRMWLVMK